MLPAYLQTYMGVPFQAHGRDRNGWDCYGLIVGVYHDQFGITLPAFTEGYQTAEDEQAIAAMITGERAAGPWREILRTQAREGDVLLIRMRGVSMHVGLVMDPPWFLHVHEGINTTLERWDGLRWRDRITGVFRHQKRMVA